MASRMGTTAAMEFSHVVTMTVMTMTDHLTDDGLVAAEASLRALAADTSETALARSFYDRTADTLRDVGVVRRAGCPQGMEARNDAG